METQATQRGQRRPRYVGQQSLRGAEPSHRVEPSKALDSSLKRHTALTKRIRQSLGAENYAQILKDIESLSLEKYIDEMSGAVMEGLGRCKTEKDVWSAVEVRYVHSLC